MIASNLGQILGRLARGEPLEYTPTKPEPEQQHGRRTDRRGQVLELVRTHGAVACRDQVAALGITNGNAAVTLLAMWRDGQLKRTGAERHYRYSLP
jgi:hypothetical protein